MTRTLSQFLRTIVSGVILIVGGNAFADGQRLVVENAGEALGETPVVVPYAGKAAIGRYRLVPENGGPATVAEVVESHGERSIAALFPSVPKGKTSFSLEGPAASSEASPVKFVKQGANLEIRVGDKPFTTYAVDLGPKPILFPLYGPGGERVSRSFPIESVEGEKRDHPHHRSFWFTHGKVNGVDFWSEEKGHGSIKETSREVVSLGQVGGMLKTTDAWIGPDGVKVCDDERVLRIYASQDDRVFDFDVTLKATEGPVLLGDTKEGTFGIRLASSMDAKPPGTGKIVNAEGLTNTDTWGKRSRWVDYSGPVGDKTVGIAILDHPTSHGHPTPWHVRDYGLFAANPFGLRDFGEKTSGDVTIPKGGELHFRYRIILHQGDAASASLEDRYRGFASPPVMTLEAK